MGERDFRPGRRRHSGRYGGHNLEGNPRRAEPGHLLAPAAENKGVAAFQSDGGLARTAQRDQDFLDLLLRPGMEPGPFPHADFLGPAGAQVRISPATR